MKKIIFWLLFYSLVIQVTHAYTLNYMDNGALVKWKNNKVILDINPTSSSNSFSSQEVVSIVRDSVSQWNASQSKLPIIDNYIVRAPSSLTNDLYFSSSDLYFGPSVAGVTVTSSDQLTGEILEADIIINDSLNLSLEQGDKYFIGDIITHEIGHFLGLAHSEASRSSMIYRLTRGQYEIEGDDRSAVRNLYNPEGYSSISGTVRGGDGVRIYGAHVKAISISTGLVAASAITQTNGNFKIGGLDGDDHYILYIDRIKAKERLPKRFAEVKSDFCYSGMAYRGSFFQSCYSRDEGYPQVIDLSRGENLNIGTLTIRCGVDVPVDYIRDKPTPSLNVDIVHKHNDLINVGETLTGHFTKTQVQESLGDEFLVEVDSEDISHLGTDNIYLEIKTIAQALYSPLRLSLRVEDQDQNMMESQVSDDVIFFKDGSPFVDNIIRFPLTLSPSTLNQLRIEVTPEDLGDFSSRIGPPLDELISEQSVFIDPLHFYILSMRLVVKENDKYEDLLYEKTFDVQGNNSCLDGPQAYAVDKTNAFSSGIVNSRQNSSAQSDLNAVGCGMLLLDKDQRPPPSSGGAVVLSFILLFLASSYFHSSNFKSFR